MSELIPAWLGLSPEVSIRWGLTLLHFLWQGAVIGLLALVAARLLRSQSASVRYWLNATALMACPICVAWTFAVVDVPESWRVSSSQHSHGSLDSGAVPIETPSANNLVDVPYPNLDPPQAVSSVDAASVPFGAASSTPATAPIAIETRTSSASEWMPIVARWIAILYGVGVVCFLVRLAIALWGGHRLRAISTPVSDSALLEQIRTQAHRIGLKLVPVVAYCERVAVPTVIGVLRPMILLPATLTTGLTTQELSAILSHELAHIRRYDLWMNLLQRIIESLLFFHPVVWLLSRRLSAEREICCDDLVIRSGHQPMNYAGALLRMAELCTGVSPQNSLSLAATSGGTSLLEHRVLRLIHETPSTRLSLNRKGVLFLTIGLMTAMAIAVTGNRWLSPGEPDPAMNQQTTAIAQESNQSSSNSSNKEERGTVEQPSNQINGGQPTNEVRLIEPSKLLGSLQTRDRQFENRSLKFELTWDELMSPQSEANEDRFNSIRFGQPDPGVPEGLPDNYQQPHRVQALWTRRGNEALVERFPDMEKAVEEKFSRMERHRLDHADIWQYLLPCGIGFADEIASVTSTEIIEDGYVIKGLLKRSSAVINGRENSFVIHVDKDLIIRRAELKYHVYDFVVVTTGTHQSPDAPATAEHGDFTKYYCVTKGDRLGERSGIAEHYAYQVIDVSDPLTDEKFDQRVRNNPLKKTYQNGIPELTLPGTPDVSVSVQKAGPTGPTIDATNPPEVEIKYPHCVLNIETLPVRTLIDSIAAFNLTSQESPTGVLQPPITEQESRDAIAKFGAEKHVPEGVRTQLEQILKSGELPSNVYFRRFTRYDDGKQMQGVWWVRLVVENKDGPVYSVPVRSTSFSARPYTQMERQQNASESMTLLNRVSSYEIPSDAFPSRIPKPSESQIDAIIEKTETALNAKDSLSLMNLYDWNNASDSTREFVTAELNQLLSGTVHDVWYSPREGHEVTTWSAWRFYKPNLPVVGYLKIEYTNNRRAAGREPSLFKV